MTERVDVRHDEAQQRFEADVPGGVAFVAYERVGDVLRLHHTEVPPAAEGRGIASQLVSYALDHARSRQLRIRPTCSYVRGYMTRHPETHSLLEEGVSLGA
jgi:predicted GNAT family acetyltransferase